MTELLEGLAHGVLGLVGFGSAYDPLSDLRSELSSKVSEFNSITAEYSYKTAVEQLKHMEVLQELMRTNGAVARAQLKVTSQMIWDTIETENLFILFLYILIFIIVLYLIIKK
jgi:hypothetical protein